MKFMSYYFIEEFLLRDEINLSKLSTIDLWIWISIIEEGLWEDIKIVK